MLLGFDPFRPVQNHRVGGGVGVRAKNSRFFLFPSFFFFTIFPGFAWTSVGGLGLLIFENHAKRTHLEFSGHLLCVSVCVLCMFCVFVLCVLVVCVLCLLCVCCCLCLFCVLCVCVCVLCVLCVLCACCVCLFCVCLLCVFVVCVCCVRVWCVCVSVCVRAYPPAPPSLPHPSPTPPHLWTPLRRLFHTPLPLRTCLRNPRSGKSWLHLLRLTFAALRVPDQFPRYLLMRLCRRLYTASQLMMPPHNYRSRSSSSGAFSPMTL